jgi:hypothetical protein
MVMTKPDISRAIPGAIIGFIGGALFVLILRALQNMDPVWDAGVALVLTPFTTTAGWMWGIGAFNPKLSEHHDPSHAIVPAEEHAEEPKPMGLLLDGVWRAATLSLLVILFFYALAALPTGLLLQTTSDPEANVAAFDTEVTVNAPIVGEFQSTQMTLFLGFVVFMLVSLIVFASLIGMLVIKGSEQVAIARQTQPTPEDLAPPAPVRALGRGAQQAARGLRKGLPKVLGNK